MKSRTRAIVCVLLAAVAAAAEPRFGERVEIGRVETEVAEVRVVQVARGLDHPWALEFLPGGGLLVTERSGRLWLLENEIFREIGGVPEVVAQRQGGLLDVIAHPDFAENQLIYLSYSASYGDGSGTRVARAKLVDHALRDVRVLFEMSPPGTRGIHYGSRFAFDDEGDLFVSLGERGEREFAQRLDNHRGKIVRLRDDGSVPDGNPFTGRDDARAEVYSFGHRNPQGLVFDPATGLLWSHEHGPRGGDALHIVRPGVNYGWPLATYGREYHGPSIGTTPDRIAGIQNPVIHWTPSIAPCGLTQLRSSAIPGWEGNLFAGALAGQHIRRIVLDGERVAHQEVLLDRVVGRVREVAAGPDGCLWFTTDSGNGGIYRIEPVRGTEL